MVCNKPHANPTIIYENIKEIHILAVGGNLEFPILSHVLLRRDEDPDQTTPLGAVEQSDLGLHCLHRPIYLKI